MIQERSGVAAEGTGAAGNGSGAGATSPSYRHPLRHYQQRAVTMVSALLTRAGLRLLMYAPTGAGKTRVLAELCRLAAAQGLRVLVIAPRKEIVSQTWRTIVDNLDPLVDGVTREDVGVIMGANVSGLDAASDKALRRPGARVQVATVQTFSARRKSSGFVPDVIIIDEAHHAHGKAGSYVGILGSFADAAVIGATATPWTPDERSLKGTFNQIEVLATVKQLLAEGILAEPLVYTHADARDLGLKDVAVVGGDFSAEALGKRMNKPRLVGNIVTHYLERVVAVRGRAVPTLCFAASVEHSKSIVKRLRAAGVRAVHLDGETKQVERDRILEALKAGDVDVVSNFGVLTEGFDAPGVECIILARPTLRHHVYRQAVGRGMRKVAGTEKVVIVLDHAGLARAFGHPGEDVPVSLEEDPRCGTGRGREWKAPTKGCLGCGQTVAATREVCPFCLTPAATGGGTEGSGAADSRGSGRSLVEEAEGELVAMVREREMGRKDKRLMFLGELRSAREVSEVTSVPLGTVQAWFAKGLDIDKAVADYVSRAATQRMFRGEMRAAREIHEMTGTSIHTVRMWFAKGLDIDKAFAEHRPLNPARGMFKGEMCTMREVQKATGASIDTVWGWFTQGLDIDKAVADYVSRAATQRMFRGEMRAAREIHEMTGTSIHTVRMWFAKGLDIDKAFADYVSRDVARRMFKGEMRTVREVQEATGASLGAVWKWFTKGLDIDEAVADYERRRTNGTHAARGVKCPTP